MTADVAEPIPIRVVDVVVVGAGFAGLYMVHRALGLGFTVAGFEAGDDVGGTWYWNRYPGARCDIDSMEYSYQFSAELQQEWEWTERYAGQPEILRYINHVADRFSLRPHFRFGTRVVSAVFDESSGRWTVTTDQGDVVDAQHLVLATGCLSTTHVPDIPGLARFRGEVHHTGDWPHQGVDFTGKRVAVIGTGSSGVQAIPQIATQAADLTVFQRTATFVVPAHNEPLDDTLVETIKADYPAFRARNWQTTSGFGGDAPSTGRRAMTVSDDERRRQYELHWQRGGLTILAAFRDLLSDPAANATLAEFAAEKIHEVVADPHVADVLTPKQMFGCKRLCLGSGYYETYNRANVHLVDASDHGIDEITATGVRVDDELHEVDCIVLATGFDAMTGSISRIDIRGRDGVALRDRWAAGPVTYLGIGVPGFPNMFIVTGPGSPSVLANMVAGAEHHVELITGCIDHMRATGKRTIESDAEAATRWVQHVNDIAAQTIFPTCNSWYVGANVPGKPRVFLPLPGWPHYVQTCTEVVANDYEGFRFTA